VGGEDCNPQLELGREDAKGKKRGKGENGFVRETKERRVNKKRGEYESF